VLVFVQEESSHPAAKFLSYKGHILEFCGSLP